jgi:hypothetical protein
MHIKPSSARVVQVIEFIANGRYLENGDFCLLWRFDFDNN